MKNGTVSPWIARGNTVIIQRSESGEIPIIQCIENEYVSTEDAAQNARVAAAAHEICGVMAMIISYWKAHGEKYPFMDSAMASLAKAGIKT